MFSVPIVRLHRKAIERQITGAGTKLCMAYVQLPAADTLENHAYKPLVRGWTANIPPQIDCYWKSSYAKRQNLRLIYTAAEQPIILWNCFLLISNTIFCFRWNFLSKHTKSSLA
jgi:hypothetical protein